MRRTRPYISYKGVKVVKRHDNTITGVRVDMTRKTTLDKGIRYGVVVTNLKTGKRYRKDTFDGIKKAFEFYKAAVA